MACFVIFDPFPTLLPRIVLGHLDKTAIAIHIIVCIIVCMDFEWDDGKNTENIHKHGLSFYEAQNAFFDKSRIILLDGKHSSVETRYFCIGKAANGSIATVRFTIRSGHIRIFGAGYWRKGKKIYEQHN